MLHVMLGGTFDPVHNGHLRMAVELHERLDGACIRLMPCHRPPHRDQPGADGATRLGMLRDAVAEEPGLLVDGRELEQDRVSYTGETLRQLRRELGDQTPLAMVVGTDAFNDFDQWREWMQLPDLAHIIVVKRPGFPLAPSAPVAAMVEQRRARNAYELQRHGGGCVHVMELPLLEIAATQVRSRAAAGRSIRYLVPDAVWRTIRDQELYRLETG
ncbi:nicotinate-nucleotide adenylyltransferase [Halomonadaceae bacterium KBTZ08]